MHPVRLVAFALLSIVLLSAAQCRGRTGPNPRQTRQLAPIEGSQVGTVSAAEITMLKTSIDTTRASYGELPLTTHPGVTLTAQIHSDDMFNRNYSTTNTKKPGVLTPRQQLEKYAGYKVGPYGEQMIVVKNVASFSEVMKEITKAGYLQAMTTKKWKNIGIAVTSSASKNYWTIIYATDPIP